MCSINWSDPAIIAAIISGGFAAVSGIVTLCVYNRKKKIEKEMNKELESYKGWIQTNNMRVQEQIDTKLERLRIEYGTLYGERLIVIEKIHIELLKLEEAFGILKAADIKKDLTEENKIKVLYLQDNFPKFLEYFNAKKIYLSKGLSSVIEMYLIVMSVDFYNLLLIVAPNAINDIIQLNLPAGLKHEDIEKFMEEINADLAKNNITAKSILADLHDEFRRLIGAEK